MWMYTTKSKLKMPSRVLENSKLMSSNADLRIPFDNEAFPAEIFSLPN